MFHSIRRLLRLKQRPLKPLPIAFTLGCCHRSLGARRRRGPREDTALQVLCPGQVRTWGRRYDDDDHNALAALAAALAAVVPLVPYFSKVLLLPLLSLLLLKRIP